MDVLIKLTRRNYPEGTLGVRIELEGDIRFILGRDEGVCFTRSSALHPLKGLYWWVVEKEAVVLRMDKVT